MLSSWAIELASLLIQQKQQSIKELANSDASYNRGWISQHASYKFLFKASTYILESPLTIISSLASCKVQTMVVTSEKLCLHATIKSTLLSEKVVNFTHLKKTHTKHKILMFIVTFEFSLFLSLQNKTLFFFASIVKDTYHNYCLWTLLWCKTVRFLKVQLPN